MEEQKDILHFMTQPAFLVEDGCITQLNTAAASLMLGVGTKLDLPEGTEPDALQEGCLYLTLNHAGQTLGASVHPYQQGLLFVISSESEQAELRALSLTAAGMRQPLTEMVQAASGLKGLVDAAAQPEAMAYLAQLNKHIYGLHRMIGNMSDAARYAAEAQGNFTCQDVVALVEEYFDHAQTLLAHSKLRLEYQLPNESILCMVDLQLLERAVYNMISNAAKFSHEGDTIHAGLSRKGQRLQLWVENAGGIPGEILTNAFTRYQRMPSIEEGRIGLGLGLVMVRTAASIHKGTVLITQPNGGTRVTLSFPIDQGRNTPLRSPALPLDYAGERDHALVELADVLPACLYIDAF